MWPLRSCFSHINSGKAAPIILGALIISLTGVSDIKAQSALLPLAGAGAFREMLLDVPPISARGALVGASIVGVHLEGQAINFNPKGIRVLLGAVGAEQGMLCVRLISRDGRYAAQARYKLGPDVAKAPLLETKTNYEKQLASYKSSDIAIAARSSASCDDQKDANLFAVDLGASPSGHLVVLMNGGNTRLRVQLGRNNKAVTQPVVCTPVAGEVRVGFAQECRIELPPGLASGAYQLSVGETASTGEIAVHTHGLTLYGIGATEK